MNLHYLAPLFDPKSLLVYVPAAGVSSIADLVRASQAKSALRGEVARRELSDGKMFGEARGLAIYEV